MLKKSRRLSTKQFKEIMKTGYFVNSSLFSARIIKNDGPARISAVAPQKVSKKATGRNKMRRIMYSAVESLWKSVKPGCNAVVIAKKDIRDIDFSEIQADIGDLLKKGRCLN